MMNAYAEATGKGVFAVKIREKPEHDGATLEPSDQPRLNKQMQAVYELMSDGRWRTLARIAEATGKPEASVSARLRDLRKEKFGGFIVERRRIAGGLHEYQVRSPE